MLSCYWDLLIWLSLRKLLMKIFNILLLLISSVNITTPFALSWQHHAPIFIVSVVFFKYRVFFSKLGWFSYSKRIIKLVSAADIHQQPIKVSEIQQPFVGAFSHVDLHKCLQPPKQRWLVIAAASCLNRHKMKEN